tara:strand:- start:424 stop:1410 length:987 start_codon:yes stop_codon:yes gene_type:complete
MIKVGIIGCGLIGQKRASNMGNFKLHGSCDLNEDRAKSFAKEFSTSLFKNPKELIECEDIDVVFVATLHDSLSELTQHSILHGKHVLVEKPAGRNLKEVSKTLEIQKNSNSKVRVGFNHRYHRSFRKLDEMVKAGTLGELMFIRAKYGHGGRIGYEKEWRADPKISGGGELIDQGPHLIDLCRQLLGEFNNIEGFAKTYYWDMPVDDNAFLSLRTNEDKTAFLHVSCTEWKNTFEMEVYGNKGKVLLSGLGGSYGTEKITLYKMSEEMGPPETFMWEFPMKDDSWEYEIEEFYKDITLNREPNASLKDAEQVHRVIQKIYKKSGYDFS